MYAVYLLEVIIKNSKANPLKLSFIHELIDFYINHSSLTALSFCLKCLFIYFFLFAFDEEICLASPIHQTRRWLVQHHRSIPWYLAFDSFYIFHIVLPFLLYLELVIPIFKLLRDITTNYACQVHYWVVMCCFMKECFVRQTPLSTFYIHSPTILCS